MGFSQEQAELQARQFELMRHEIESSLATKKDVAELIAESEKEIIKYVGSQNLKTIGILGALMIGQLGFLVALLRFLPDFIK